LFRQNIKKYNLIWIFIDKKKNILILSGILKIFSESEKMRKALFPIILVLVIISGVNIVKACTTAIVSGKASKDGRPLLLKNRDSDELNNKLMYFNDGKYSYMGIVNSKDKEGKEVWGGFNSAGFAIMNSASYNLKRNDTTKLTDREGVIMKEALKVCATIADFEKFLNSFPKPLGVEANFGVIDAEGGACYFETGNFSFVKYDVNDPSVAPDGYIIRTNYSCSGVEDKGAGYIRYATAEQVFKTKYKKEKLDCDFLYNDVVRCLKHSLTNTDLIKQLPKDGEDTKYVWFQDYIPRTSTASAIVVQGVKKGENPLLTTMWSSVGFPLTAVVVPVWMTREGKMPEILKADSTGKAPMCEMAMKLKNEIFPKRQQIGDKYMNLALLVNKAKTGFRQKLDAAEKEVAKKGLGLMTEWRNGNPDEKQMNDYYKWADEFIKEKYSLILKGL
jgi:hypothetical protein